MLLAFVVVYKYLQCVQGGDEGELLAHLDVANKLAQELNYSKKDLKAAMFDNKLASFSVFPSKGDVSIGKLAFTNMQLPFNKLDMTSNELKRVDIRRADYEFLLPCRWRTASASWPSSYSPKVT